MGHKIKLPADLLDGSLADKALNAANDGITIADMKQKDYPLIFVNRAFEEMTGYNKEEVIGKNCRFLQGNLAQQPELSIIRKAIKNRKNCRVVIKNIKKDGTLFWNELSLAPIMDPDQTLAYYVGVQKDLTNEMMHKQQIAYLAEHDVLTGLDNYRGFFSKFNDLLIRGKKEKGYLAIGIADIDSFKVINDQYGHVKGNEILKLIGSKCIEEFRDYDIAARFGGDEFCFALLTKLEQPYFFYKKIENIVNYVNESLANSPKISISSGISIEKISNKTRVDNLIHMADCVMYQNKQRTHQDS